MVCGEYLFVRCHKVTDYRAGHNIGIHAGHYCRTFAVIEMCNELCSLGFLGRNLEVFSLCDGLEILWVEVVLDLISPVIIALYNDELCFRMNHVRIDLRQQILQLNTFNLPPPH